MARVELIHGLSNPVEPSTVEVDGDGSVLLVNAPGAPTSRVRWSGAEKGTRFRARPLRHPSKVVVGKPIDLDHVSDAGILRTSVAQLDGPTATYTFSREALRVGRYTVWFAWTAEARGLAEKVCAVTQHRVWVLPEHPLGAWVQDKPTARLLDLVCDHAANTTTPSEAFDRFVERCWTDPGQLVYDPDGDAFLAPDQIQQDRMLDTTTLGAAASNDSSAVITELLARSLGSELGRTAGALSLRVNCIGLTQFAGLVAHLLGLPVERWGIEPLVTRRELHCLGSMELGGRERFETHAVLVRREGSTLYVKDVALSDTAGVPWPWMPIGDYEQSLDLKNAAWTRRGIRGARPLIRRVQALRASGPRGQALARQVRLQRDSLRKDHPEASLLGVLIGRGQPGWAAGLWVVDHPSGGRALLRRLIEVPRQRRRNEISRWISIIRSRLRRWRNDHGL